MECLKNRPFERVLGSGIELSVGIGARPAFSIEKITFGIEFASPREPCHRSAALLERGTSVDDIHSDAVHGQCPCCVEASGTGADDDDAALMPEGVVSLDFEGHRRGERSRTAAFDRLVQCSGRRLLSIQFEVNVIDESDIVGSSPPARINSLPRDSEPSDCLFGYADTFRTLCGQ